MNWLIPAAHAQASAAPAGQAPEWLSLVMIGGMFVIFYFLIIRPQRKRQKEVQSMLSTLSVGDEVSTNAGILGKVRKVDDAYVVLKVADNVELKFQKAAILAILPKGTLKAI
jgi:preprotein translocase subunit YajC